VCTHLLSLDFTAEHAVLAADSVFDLAADASTRSTELVARGDDPRRHLADEWARPLDPALGAVIADAITGDPVDWFARKLAVILAGIDCELAP
jgi:hypothetical protein